ncbi:NAD-dependent deacylase [Halorhodospira halochloris]|uniref:NAD-dependent deacylase n=1 Tax=Halorhodospira halochloris TaxID=1052 RepID=UPI001EE7B20C|nr:NAD-dependent deacylase [Halorhodospira halochloris]MCG5531088.1 NAD-dependent deacylase [Halorhodospira halochloris]
MIDKSLQQLLRQTSNIVALTGAGVSAESGIPTFRDAQQGTWANFDPMELATLEGFLRQPHKVWDWYQQRREMAAKAQPNAAHLALAEWQEQLEQCLIVTQNVDGLHQRAGSLHVIELHGNLHRDRPISQQLPAEKAADLPRCPETGNVLRPDVVWFGEMLPEGAMEQALSAIEVSDLVLSIGTSAVVQPAASIPLHALENGVPVVEINPEATELSSAADWSLRGSAADVVPQLVAAAQLHYSRDRLSR